jgi:IMP dehydrogenase
VDQGPPPVYDTAITLSPTSTVGDALSLLTKRAHGIVVVVEDGVPVGVVTDGQCQGVDRFTQLSQVMTEDPLTVPPAPTCRRSSTSSPASG